MKRKSLQRVITLAITMTMVGSLVACGGTKEEVKTETEGKSKSKETTISFMDTMPSPERQAFFEKAISEYEKENSGITIEYTSVPWDEAYKKLVSMSATKSLPDVFTGDTGIITALASNGGITDLTEKFKAMPSYGDLNAATLAGSSTYSFQGKTYAIPDGFLSQGIFVRSDWLKDAGYQVEDLQHWTWDQYDEVVAKLTKAEEGRFGMAFRGGNNGCLRLLEYLGSNLEVTEMFPNGNNQSIFEDERTLALFEKFYGNYINGNSPKDSINWAFKEQVEGFANGQCATVNQTPEVIAMCQESMQEGTWTVLPQPVKADAKTHCYTWGVSGAYMLAENSKVSEEAWNFIEWLSTPEKNLEYTKEFSCNPLYNSAMKDPFFSEGYMKAYAEQMTDSKVTYLSQPSELTQWGYFLSEFGKVETQKYMAGEQTAKETVDHIASWMRENYDKDIANKTK